MAVRVRPFGARTSLQGPAFTTRWGEIIGGSTTAYALLDVVAETCGFALPTPVTVSIDEVDGTDLYTITSLTGLVDLLGITESFTYSTLILLTDVGVSESDILSTLGAIINLDVGNTSETYSGVGQSTFVDTFDVIENTGVVGVVLGYTDALQVSPNTNTLGMVVYILLDGTLITDGTILSSIVLQVLDLMTESEQFTQIIAPGLLTDLTFALDIPIGVNSLLIVDSGGGVVDRVSLGSKPIPFIDISPSILELISWIDLGTGIIIFPRGVLNSKAIEDSVVPTAPDVPILETTPTAGRG